MDNCRVFDKGRRVLLQRFIWNQCQLEQSQSRSLESRCSKLQWKIHSNGTFFYFNTSNNPQNKRAQSFLPKKQIPLSSRTVEQIQGAIGKNGKLTLAAYRTKELLEEIKGGLIEILEKRAEEPLIVRLVQYCKQKQISTFWIINILDITTGRERTVKVNVIWR